METLTVSEARRTLAAVMDRVTDQRSPIIVTRPGRGSVVLIALSQWMAIQDVLGSSSPDGP